jgi:hypothetical protein
MRSVVQQYIKRQRAAHSRIARRRRRREYCCDLDRSVRSGQQRCLRFSLGGSDKVTGGQHSATDQHWTPRYKYNGTQQPVLTGSQQSCLRSGIEDREGIGMLRQLKQVPHAQLVVPPTRCACAAEMEE